MKNQKKLKWGRTNILLKNLSALFLNSLVLWLGWEWIIVTIFSLPSISYFIWMTLLIVNIRLKKNIGDFGLSTILTKEREMGKGIDNWAELLLTYGFTIGVEWLCYHFLILPFY